MRPLALLLLALTAACGDPAPDGHDGSLISCSSPAPGAVCPDVCTTDTETDRVACCVVLAPNNHCWECADSELRVWREKTIDCAYDHDAPLLDAPVDAPIDALPDAVLK